MPSEMVERVARALEPDFDDYAADAQDMILKDARAAIEAMRRPTHAMTIEGMSADDLRTGFETCKHIYQAMIDAALAETGSPAMSHSE